MRHGTFRVSALLILAAVLLPLALLPLGRLVPTLGTEAGELSRQAAAAATQVAANLAREAEPSPGAATDPAHLAAALSGALPQGGIRLAILGPDGRLLASAFGDAASGSAPFLTAEHAVAGWPLRVLAIRVAPAPQAGLLPLGAAMLAMLSLALLAYRRERRAYAAAAAEERREAMRAATLAESEAQLRLARAAAELGCWSWDEAADCVTWMPRRPRSLAGAPPARLAWRRCGIASIPPIGRCWTP